MADQEEIDPYMAVGEEEVHRLIRENSHIFTDSQCKVCSAVLISESQKLAHYQSKKHANKVRRYMVLNQESESSSKKIKLDGSVGESRSNGAEDRNKCCPICNMTFSAPVVAASHYEGKTHAKNLRLKEQGPFAPGMALGMARAPNTAPPVRSAAQTDAVDTSDPEKFCKLCSATFNNSLMAQQHYTGKKHKKNETKNQLMGQYRAPPNAPVIASSKNPATALAAAAKWYTCEDCKITLNSVEQYQAHISGAKHKAVVGAKPSGRIEEEEQRYQRPTRRPLPPPARPVPPMARSLPPPARMLPPLEHRFQQMSHPEDNRGNFGSSSYYDRNY